MLEEFQKYFFTWSNPLIYIVFFGVLMSCITYVVLKFIILPNQRKHIEEKVRLEQKQRELMSLMAELDPDPIMRVDRTGHITLSNQAAIDHFSLENLANPHFARVISDFHIDWDDYISKNDTLQTTYQYKDRYYIIDLKGIEELDIAQVYFHDITQRVVYEKELDQYKNRLRILSEHLDTQLEEVRETVAQSLHDDIGQQIFALKLLFQRKEYEAVPQHLVDSVMEKFDSIYQTIRKLSRDLKPVRLEDISLVGSLRQLITHFNESGQIQGEFITNNEKLALSNRIRTCIFRVSQEGIVNILKHSQATEYVVSLIEKNADVRLTISDNGMGIKSNNHSPRVYFQSGIGLFNMKERVEYLHGKITIDSAPKRGFNIYVTLPKV